MYCTNFYRVKNNTSIQYRMALYYTPPMPDRLPRHIEPRHTRLASTHAPLYPYIDWAIANLRDQLSRAALHALQESHFRPYLYDRIEKIQRNTTVMHRKRRGENDKVWSHYDYLSLYLRIWNFAKSCTLVYVVDLIGYLRRR